MFWQNSTNVSAMQYTTYVLTVIHMTIKYFNSCNLDLETTLTAHLFLYLLGGVQPVLKDSRQKSHWADWKHG